jgi:hypothetical protein
VHSILLLFVGTTIIMMMIMVAIIIIVGVGWYCYAFLLIEYGPTPPLHTLCQTLVIRVMSATGLHGRGQFANSAARVELRLVYLQEVLQGVGPLQHNTHLQQRPQVLLQIQSTLPHHFVIKPVTCKYPYFRVALVRLFHVDFFLLAKPGGKVKPPLPW